MHTDPPGGGGGGGGGRLHFKFARMCVLRIEKYTHFEGLLKN